MGYSKGELFLGPPQPEREPDAADFRCMRARYDKASPGFCFLAVDTNELFFRETQTYGTWSSPVSFQADTRAISLPTTPAAPTPARRYYRLQGWSAEGLNSNTFDLAEIRLFQGASTLITGITCTTNISFAGGSSSLLVDGNTSNRAYTDSWSGQRATAYIQFDLGSAISVTGVQFFIGYEQPRLPATFELWSSDSESSGYELAAALGKGSVTEITPGTSYRTDEIPVGVPAGVDLTNEAAMGTIGTWQDRAYIYLGGDTPGWKRMTLS